MESKPSLSGRFNAFIKSPDAKVMLAFALEGLLLQFSTSVKGSGNNMFATNLGATDTQISLIQTFGCIGTLVMLLPVGIISDRCKSAKTMPVILSFLCGIVFMLQAFVPMMGTARLAMFFLFVALSSSMFGSYNSQWQSMFGDMVEQDSRNRIYALRNRVMAVMGVVAPIICSMALATQKDSEGNLFVLSVFLFIAGIMMIIQGIVVYKIPGGRRTAEQLNAVEHFSMKNVGEAILSAAKNKQFMSFVLAAMLLYTCYQVDWSTWYIAQKQYVHLTDADYSLYGAICCAVSIFSLGFLSRLIQKKSVHFVACITIGSLVFSPVYMLIITALPDSVRPVVFMTLCVTQNMFEVGIGMCVVQMLLEAVPALHRSLTVSLYTVLITISNSFMPLLGVKLYTALGADLPALRTYYIIIGLWRVGVTVFFVMRYLKFKKQGKIHIAAQKQAA